MNILLSVYVVCALLYLIRLSFVMWVDDKTLNRVSYLNTLDIQRATSMAMLEIMSDKRKNRWKVFNSVSWWRKVFFVWENPMNWYKGCDFDIFHTTKNEVK